MTYYYLVRWILEKFWLLTYRLDLLKAGDEVFFEDDDQQIANIIAFQKVEKFQADKFKMAQIKKAFQFTRLKSKVVKFLGRIWFKELPEEYILQNINRCMIQKSGVHNEKQLAEFMEKEQAIREPYDFVQWRVYIFEDYSATESLFVFKIHHSVADGIAIILMNFNL